MCVCMCVYIYIYIYIYSLTDAPGPRAALLDGLRMVPAPPKRSAQLSIYLYKLYSIYIYIYI